MPINGSGCECEVEMMDDEEQAPVWQKNEMGMQDARSGAREG